MSVTNFTKYYNSDYIFIFDYYDIPLFFISKNEEQSSYYLFYFFDYNEYFFSELDKQKIELLFSGKDIRSILLELQKNESLSVMKFNDNDTELIPVEDFFNAISLSFEDVLPDEGEYIEFDRLTEKKYDELKDNYQEYFPEFFNLKDLTLRLVNQQNSNHFPVDIVLESINYIKKVFEDYKERLSTNKSETTLEIAAISPGSLKIDFTLRDAPQMTLFEEVSNFDELIDFINNLKFGEGENLSKQEIIINKSIINATNEFYNLLEDEKLSVEFISNNKVMTELRQSDEMKRNLKNFYDVIKEEIKDTIVTEEVLSIRGEVLSANKSRNHFKIKTLEYGDISGIFEKNLFKRIKNSEEQITVSKNISATLKKVVESQPEFSIMKVKYILESFIQ